MSNHLITPVLAACAIAAAGCGSDNGTAPRSSWSYPTPGTYILATMGGVALPYSRTIMDTTFTFVADTLVLNADSTYRSHGLIRVSSVGFMAVDTAPVTGTWHMIDTTEDLGMLGMGHFLGCCHFVPTVNPGPFPYGSIIHPIWIAPPYYIGFVNVNSVLDSLRQSGYTPHPSNPAEELQFGTDAIYWGPVVYTNIPNPPYVQEDFPVDSTLVVFTGDVSLGYRIFSINVSNVPKGSDVQILQPYNTGLIAVYRRLH